jgi:hypothetical protein
MLSRAFLGRFLPPVLALLLAASGLAILPGRVAAWTPGDYNAASESELVALTNQARAAAGLPALKVDGTLRQIARWRSKDMIDRDYFSHSIPGGGDVFAEMTRQGFCFDLAGENIGWNTYPDAEATAAIQGMFMGSAGHRANLLGPAWVWVSASAWASAWESPRTGRRTGRSTSSCRHRPSTRRRRSRTMPAPGGSPGGPPSP